MKENKSPLVARENNEPEKIVAKNNHGFDAWTYSLDFRPLLFRPKQVVPEQQTIREFIRRAEAAGRRSERHRRGIIVV